MWELERHQQIRKQNCLSENEIVFLEFFFLICVPGAHGGIFTLILFYYLPKIS